MTQAALTRRDALGVLAALSAAATSPPAAATLSLAGGQRSVTLPFELIDNRLFVKVEVNGQGPLHFIFDTGGGNILDTAVAEQLGLPLGSGFSMPGAGQGVLPAWRTHVAQAQVGALQMHELPFVVLPLQALRQAIGFARLDGLIGHEVLRRFVVKLDFVSQRVTLSEPSTDRSVPAGAIALPIEFTGNLPHIAGWIDGHPGRIVIDSGDRSSLTLFVPFVNEFGLRQAYPRRFAALTGWGVGGPLPADVVQVQELLLGPLPVRNVTTRMPTGRGGVFASRQAQASIGTGVLKRFDVSFDYAKQRVLLAPNAQHQQPDPVDHSGLWLALGDGAWTVEHVSDNSPASRAGLRLGDRVLAVDGQSVQRLSLPALRQRWAEQGPGLVALLTLETENGSSRVQRLLLQDRFAQTLVQG